MIAALLQYFFIAMFCWAVCEGLQLFMTLMTGKKNNPSRLKFFYIIGWSKLTIYVTHFPKDNLRFLISLLKDKTTLK